MNTTATPQVESKQSAAMVMVDRLNQMIDRANNIENRLEAANGNLWGAEPQPVADSDKAVSSGLIANINDKLETLDGLLGNITSEVSKLENLTG